MELSKVPMHISVQLAWHIANTEACLAGSLRIEPVHFLMAALKIADDVYEETAQSFSYSNEALEGIRLVGAECRLMLGLSDEELTVARRELRRILREKSTPRPVRKLHRTEESHSLFNAAAARMLAMGDRRMTLSHMVREMIEAMPSKAAPVFNQQPRLSEAAPFRSDEQDSEAQADNSHHVLMRDTHFYSTSTPTLDRLGRDLTALARDGQLTPVVGRRAEITALARYLQRTTKRNVLIIGEAGVGKTAVVEGLAQRLVSENAPDFLRRLRIVQISLADLTSGAKYRGDLEQRIQELLAEAKSESDLVLFFDEVHLMMTGAGGASGEIANQLKPALAGSDIRCIGATTLDEYERYILNDAAFMRRFQTLRVAEPSSEEATLICREWARRVERIQGVEIDEEAITAAVELSDRFIHRRSLPDKAIDLLENAATFVKVTTVSFSNKPEGKGPVRITREVIQKALRELYEVEAGDGAWLDPARAENNLRAALIGQEKAVGEIAQALASAANRSDGARRPAAVLMFAGPSGVGKTFAAETLTSALFGSADRAMFRCNMNEFKSQHELARLIGAPPGFIGHDQYGSLFRYVEAHPRGVILLDEMDKAHPEVQDYFLQIFDKGEARDSRGRAADFSQHIFVLTCNTQVFGATERNIGFFNNPDKTKTHEIPLEELLRHYRRELLARIDQIIIFRSLTAEDYRAALGERIEQLASQLSEEDVQLEIEEGAMTLLCEMCASQGEGVRGLNKLYEQMVVALLNRYLEDNPDADVARVKAESGQLIIT